MKTERKDERKVARTDEEAGKGRILIIKQR